MKKYRRLFTFLVVAIMVLASHTSKAQLLNELGKITQKAAENAVKKSVEKKTDEKVTKKTDETIDKATGVKVKKKTETGESSETGSKESTSKKSDNEKQNSLEELSEEGENEVVFKRGDKVLFEDNFEKDAVGDFPARWNTNKGGEVKKLKSYPEKWLKVPAGSIINLELSKPLPENFTAELDLILPADHPYRRPGIGFGKKPRDIDYLISDADAVTFDIISAELESGGKYYNLNYATPDMTKREKINYTAPLNKKIHIAYVVNGKRIRMYVDDKKMVDLPNGMKPDYRKSFFVNSITSGWKETKEAYFYMSNIVIAETGKDQRSQVLKELLEKGSFSTNAILFASGSDKLLPASDEILNQLYQALNEEQTLKVMIAGHTDSDGDDAKNLTLSQKRAQSVKNWLMNKGITASRMSVEGKGEKEPLESNDTPEGKAQNRRVEFKVVK